MGWVRLNTDGGSKGNPGPSGAGWAIRDHRGTLLLAFASDCVGDGGSEEREMVVSDENQRGNGGSEEGEYDGGWELLMD
ncbi:hypothetical protein RDABS01_038953 [Bienertia sinuspersici]